MAIAALALVAAAAILILRGTRASRPTAEPARARSLLLVTIDTLRADHVGVYGAGGVATPALDRIGRSGVRFDRAFAPAPITLTSHASLLSGRYPPGHGARHNGMAMEASVPTLATALRAGGFKTAAFIAAFPLDHRFGLARGFDVYSDAMPRGPDGRLANERPGSTVVDEALGWLAEHRGERFFLWVHLFEPHAPYGDALRTPNLTAIQRYDLEIATADAQVGRLLDGLGPAEASTLVIAAGDHGEAFGEHGEIAHSIFVYDTTLRVPLLMAGAGIPAPGSVVADPVCLVDLLPTSLALLGLPRMDSDGVDLSPALAGSRLAPRDLYAESFAPLLDFGWSPLRAVRSGRWKVIEAPRPELFDMERDPGEQNDLAAEERAALLAMTARLDRFGPPGLPARAAMPVSGDPEARSRLRALGYASGRAETPPGAPRPDPKDRKALAARIATVTSGEVGGAELRATLESILADDPGNGQAHLRLGFVLLDLGLPGQAAPHFTAAISAGMPTADPYLGMAACQAAQGASERALGTLRQADAVDPGNPVVAANIGLLEGQLGRTDAAVAALSKALAAIPIFTRRGSTWPSCTRGRAAAPRRRQAALELLRRLPSDAPQRTEVERLLARVQ